MMIEPNTLIAAQSMAHSGFDAAAGAIRKARNETQIDRAAQEFEAMFVAEMMKPMFEGLEVDPMFGGGRGEEVFRGLLLQEYGKVMAATGTLGIADAVRRQMIEMQQAADGGSPLLEANISHNSTQEVTHNDATTR